MKCFSDKSANSSNLWIIAILYEFYLLACIQLPIEVVEVEFDREIGKAVIFDELWDIYKRLN